jgi:intein/homing endonuclease
MTTENNIQPVLQRFKLLYTTKKRLNEGTPKFGFNGLGEVVFRRTYSRDNESWNDVVKRVIEGVMSIRKEHFVRNSLEWNDDHWQEFAKEMAMSLFNMEWMPPGRGLWMMGTDFMYARGSTSLNNCSAVDTKDDLVHAAEWTMDCLMNGVGVGFSTNWGGEATKPNKEDTITFTIPDSREGWLESLTKLLCSYINSKKYGKNKYPIMDYSQIRPSGTPIKGFGGVSSGPEPLKKLHQRVESYLDAFCDQKLEARVKTWKEVFDESTGKSEWREVEVDISKPYDHTRLIADIFNAIGACVVAGNVRRCLPGDALVHTENGLIPIKDVQVGQKVMTMDGYHTIANIFSQGEQQLIRIKTQDGDFRCTPNHKMAVCSSYDTYIWKEASTLTPGDRLIAPRYQISGQITSLPVWTYDKPDGSTTCKDIVIPELDCDIAWLIGVFHGNGYVYANDKNNGFNAYISIVGGIKEWDTMRDVQKQLQRFGKDLTVTLEKRNGENSYIVRCQSKQLALYFDKYVKQPKTCIKIPDYILRAGNDIKLAYVAGVTDTDGCLTNRPINVVSTIYEQFAREIQILLYSCGIESRLNIVTKDYPSREDNWSRVHQVNLITKHSQTMFDNIPQLHKNMVKNSRSQNANGFPTEYETDTKIKSKFGLYSNKQFNLDAYDKQYGISNIIPIEVIGTENDTIEQTWDIEVENKHEFICNGYLTHNSAEIALGNVNDQTFINLKNYVENPERGEIGWMSNNSVVLNSDHDYEDFSYIPDMARRIIDNGEPGMINLYNIQKFGRYGKEMEDKANLVNPCFSGETLIATADGRGYVSIKQLADEGKDIPLYSMDEVTGEVSIQWGRHPRITGDNQKLLRIHFGDSNKGEFLDVTPNHKFFLNDGKIIEAKDLKKGDSLPQFKKTSFNDGYHRIYTSNTKKYRAEHRMIAEFHNPDKFYSKYEKNKYNGCCKTHNVVVHHKDEDKTNNNPENLEITTANDHNRIHNMEYVGEGNPMYGKKHSLTTKILIGNKCQKRYENPEYIKMLSDSQTPKMREQSSINMKNTRQQKLIEYYDHIQTENNGLTLVRESPVELNVIKICENNQCSCTFKVPWGKREYSFCSRACANTKSETIQLRKNGQSKTFEGKAKDNFHKQAMLYKDLLEQTGNVEKKNFEKICKENNITCRFNANSSNPFIAKNWTQFKQMVNDHNHRVSYIEELDGEHTVYNITVDKNHTLAVVTKLNKSSMSGIFTRNCGEIPLN